MRIRPILTTVFGVAIAAGSVFLAKDRLMVAEPTKAESEAPALVDIYIARTEIPFGQTIESHMVKAQPWPVEALPPGAFTDVSKLIPANRQDLRRAKGRFFPGEVIIVSKVSDFGDKVTLVQKLGENTRAMAIKVDAVTAVGGFVTPGDYVDIVMTQGNGGDLRALTILQKIRVIGVDQTSEEKKDQPAVARTITVEVTPEEGQRLALAQKAGTLSLTLRTLDAVEDKPLEMVRLRDLLQNESPVPEDQVRSPTVTVRRGTASEEVTIKRSPLVPRIAETAPQQVPAAPAPTQVTPVAPVVAAPQTAPATVPGVTSEPATNPVANATPVVPRVAPVVPVAPVPAPATEPAQATEPAVPTPEATKPVVEAEVTPSVVRPVARPLPLPLTGTITPPVVVSPRILPINATQVPAQEGT